MKKFFIGLSVFLIVLIIGSVVIYRRSVALYNDTEEQAIEYAIANSEIVSATDFYWYNDTETTFTVVGETEEGESLVVFTNQETQETTTLNISDTIPKQQAVQLTREARQPKKILNARMGIDNQRPVWEISYRNQNGRLGYYILSLQDGEWIRTIDNI
ncbi:DUF5590 domain-containing protein [Marinilactibacillus sp. XAAS-LB27]|uniref:cell wall elongation regulator TseB-like domain-containing protein n=1 Tax=Marinilactibacillus sp. XAAS-LB27 TaxID=3114538 RepID=UPI002E18E145|nr:DUF5590 domain-containing protein [Marinilactibacillus sp. XAAS-LB27]